jgi:hypothetical protein
MKSSKNFPEHVKAERVFGRHMHKGVDAQTHADAATHEVGRREGRNKAIAGGAAASVAAGGAGYLAGKHDKEKKAFGALLGALGGALAGSGLRAGMAGAAKSALTGLAGAATSGGGAAGMGGLASKAMNFVKANPMKAIGAGMNAAQNFSQARQSGQGIGGAALSGLAGGASALG